MGNLLALPWGQKTRSFGILYTPATTHNEYRRIFNKQKDFYRIFPSPPQLDSQRFRHIYDFPGKICAAARPPAGAAMSYLVFIFQQGRRRRAALLRAPARFATFPAHFLARSMHLRGAARRCHSFFFKQVRHVGP